MRIPHAVRGPAGDVESLPAPQIALVPLDIDAQRAGLNLEMLVLSGVVMRWRCAPAGRVGGLEHEHGRRLLEDVERLTRGDVEAVSHGPSFIRRPGPGIVWRNPAELSTGVYPESVRNRAAPTGCAPTHSIG
jgi:hypothetical protein